MRTVAVVGAGLLALTAGPSSAAGVANVQVSGTSASATVSLAGGLEADLTIGFEQALGLSAESLGLSAASVSPLSLAGRLPAGVEAVAAFPVVVKIEPPAAGPLSFSGLATVELHTHNLTFAPATPLRLFRSRAGGPFVDVTESMGMGSYRVRGSTGGFSEFAILADLRQPDAVIVVKFDALQSLLDAAALGEPLAGALQSRLDAAYAAWQSASYVVAAQETAAFADLVAAHAGNEIPDVWRSAGDLDNPAGELRAAAASLRFSLNLRASSGI
jgi:hypothetical protein